MEQHKDLMKQYTSAQGSVYQTPEMKASPSKKEYTAFSGSKNRRVSRFKIITAEQHYGCSFAHLIDWMYTPSHLLTLHTSSRIFIIQGKHLDRIEELLLEEKIKEMQVFNPQIHLQPNTDSVFIESIEVISPQASQ